MQRLKSTARLSISLVILTAILLPTAALAGEPAQLLRIGADTDVTEPQGIRGGFVIRVKGYRASGFFERYLFAKTHRVDLDAVLAKTEAQWRLANALSDITEQLTAALRPPVWKQDYIPFSLPL